MRKRDCIGESDLVWTNRWELYEGIISRVVFFRWFSRV